MCKDKLVWLTLKAVILSEVEPVLINQWADWDALVHILGWHDFVLKPNLSKQVSTCAREWAFLFQHWKMFQSLNTVVYSLQSSIFLTAYDVQDHSGAEAYPSYMVQKAGYFQFIKELKTETIHILNYLERFCVGTGTGRNSGPRLEILLL